MTIAPPRTPPQSARASRAGRLTRALRNAVAVLIIYGNVAVALQPAALRRIGLRVPRPAVLHDAFLMTGMFGSYSLTNSDFVLLGQRTQAGLTQDRGRWIRLHLRDHFASRHGVVFTQLIAAHHWDVLGTGAQRRAWAFLSQRIRERHNRLHPERAVARVRIGSVEWPQSPLGYRAAKATGPLRSQIWFSEAKP